MVRQPNTYTATFALLAAVTFGTAATNLPDEIAASEAKVVLQVHAEGAQIYECKATASGQLSWQFREPIATLIVDGKTVGRHYAGPAWDHSDGSGVKGRVVSSTPGATPNDIPWLKLEIVDHRNSGVLSSATAVKRINTRGGVARGSCERAGDFLDVPYSADYVFLREGI